LHIKVAKNFEQIPCREDDVGGEDDVLEKTKWWRRRSGGEDEVVEKTSSWRRNLNSAPF